MLLALAIAAMGQAPALPAPSPPGAGQTMSPPDAWVQKGVAELVLLDKLRGQPGALAVKVGQNATFGSLTIAVTGCVTRPPDLPQNAAAFLEITDSKGSAPPFRGWVASNTPSVSVYEHPVYDVRLVTCR